MSNKCKKCGESEGQVKRGFTVAGSQKYYCKKCNSIYTPVTKHYSEETKALAIKEYYAGASGREVGKIHGFSKSNVFRWLKKTDGRMDKSKDRF